MAWYHRVRNAFRRDRVQSEIEREVAFHIAERADELRDDGMSDEEAARDARKRFGNVTLQSERTGDADTSGWLEAMVRNIRYSSRTLAKTPVFTIAVITTLALGIGANSAVFSAIQTVLLRPLPFPEGDRLMDLGHTTPEGRKLFVAPPRLRDWSQMAKAFQSITGYYTQNTSELSGELPEQYKQAFVSPRFLETWGVAPAYGRDFSPEEERFGGPKAVIVSDRYARNRFGGGQNAVGKMFRTGTLPFEIVGVMPASFLFPDREVEVWSPSPMDAPYAQDRRPTWFTVVGRLKPGMTPEQGQADLAAVQANLGRQFPTTDANLKVIVRPLKDVAVGEIGKSLWLLYGAVSLLLLIACTNIAALLLSRGTQRQHEISIRFSLGASRATVVGQLLTECFVLALGGSALGLSLAAAATRALRSAGANLPRVDEISLDWRIVLYTLVCAMITTLLCGLYPALRGTRGSGSGALIQSVRSQVSGHNRVHLSLVGVQVALAVALLVGAGLLLRSFQELGRVSPGFDPGNVLTLRITTTWAETGTKDLAQKTRRIIDQVANTPGVESAAMAMVLPGVPFEYERELKMDDSRADAEAKIVAESRYVSADYFTTMRIPLVQGEPSCRAGSAEQGVVVNRSFVNTYLANSTVIGRRIRAVNSSKLVEIRGIAGDAREAGIDRAPVPTAYWCYEIAQPGAIFLARTRGEPMAMAETLRRRLREIEPGRSVFGISPLEAKIDDVFDENRLRTILLTFFAVTAVLLASVGIYGTLSYLVDTRRREIGLRMALGALRTQIVGHFLAQGVGVAVVASVAGLALAVASGRVLSGMLYGVSPTDIITLTGAVLIVLSVAIIASLLPAVRAARLDAIQVLRDE